MVRGRAKLAIAQGVSVWVLEAPDGFGDADFHTHHAIQITICLSGALSLTSGPITISAPAIAVAADASHRFEADGLLLFIFVEPESRAGRALGRRLFTEYVLVELEAEDLLAIVEPIRNTFSAQLLVAALLDAGHSVVDHLAAAAPAPLSDPRVQKVIEHIAVHPEQSLDDAAAACGVHLSPSRLRHLFVEQTGIAFKTYLLWLRLMRALDVYAQGRSLTQAAHSAGFSDSAHFSRVFKRTFGPPATTLERL